MKHTNESTDRLDGDIYIDKEFNDKAQFEYTCVDCGRHGSFKDIEIAIDVNETMKRGIKVEVMFCSRCGSENFK